jgi:hypothetical protein
MRHVNLVIEIALVSSPAFKCGRMTLRLVTSLVLITVFRVLAFLKLVTLSSQLSPFHNWSSESGYQREFLMITDRHGL